MPLLNFTVCRFVNSLFRDLGSIELGFVSEEDLEESEEIQRYDDWENGW